MRQVSSRGSWRNFSQSVPLQYLHQRAPTSLARFSKVCPQVQRMCTLRLEKRRIRSASSSITCSKGIPWGVQRSGEASVLRTQILQDLRLLGGHNFIRQNGHPESFRRIV